MTKVRLEREIDLPGFPASWKLVRTEDGRTEANGFKSTAEAETWAPKWGCQIVERKNSVITRSELLKYGKRSGLELGSSKYGTRR